MIKVSWVEIPVRDIERALTFYRAVFELGAVDVVDDGVRKTATLTGDAALGTSLNQTPNFTPNNTGTLAYFNAGSNVTAFLDRATAAGGTIIAPKTAMGGGFFYALVQDTEGNVFALSSAEPE
ncbi:MAG: VOC family protein [Chloroflexota bacterium]|nr:VOC family protein [Chloroflexota bacterium]